MNNSAKNIYKEEKRKKIKQELDIKRLPCAVGISESKFFENVGGIIRTINAFLLQEIVLDEKVYNKYACAGADKWENIIIQKDIISYFKKNNYTLIALEQHEKSIPLWDFKFPLKSAIIMGHEVQGMTDEMLNQCDFTIEIPQYGLVESLNVSTATSIALYEYSRQHRACL